MIIGVIWKRLSLIPYGTEWGMIILVGDRATGYADDKRLLLDCGLSRGFGFGCGHWTLSI